MPTTNFLNHKSLHHTCAYLMQAQSFLVWQENLSPSRFCLPIRQTVYKLLLIAPSFESSSSSPCLFPLWDTESQADRFPYDTDSKSGTLLGVIFNKGNHKFHSSKIFLTPGKTLNKLITKSYLQKAFDSFTCWANSHEEASTKHSRQEDLR